MTAGSGVVHSEMPSDEFLKRGGKSEGFQLWVNLPAKDKMIKPRYQDTDTKKIPVVTSPGIVYCDFRDFHKLYRTCSFRKYPHPLTEGHWKFQRELGGGGGGVSKAKTFKGKY